MDEVQTEMVGAEGSGVGSLSLPPIGVTDQRSPSVAPRFRLTERDLDILKFLHEQQFASLPMLYFCSAGGLMETLSRSEREIEPAVVWIRGILTNHLLEFNRS